MSRERGAVVLATVMLLNACGGGKPVATRTVTFAPPADTILTNYVNVPMAAWLGGTTWAEVAGEFNEAAIVDFTSRTVRKLGTRQVEIRNPFGVYAAGDTAWVTDWGLGRATDPVYGARPLKRAIQQSIENPLAMEILKGRFPEGAEVLADAEGDRITFNRD